MKTSAIFFAFDLFGSGGSAAGVELLADELREVLADNRRETVPTRARAYTEHVRLREAAFDTMDALAGWRQKGRQLARQALRQGDFLLWISGNHLGALPVYDELAAEGGSALVVQLDAHLDIHHFRDCAKEPSHGNFLLHVEGELPPVVNVGHRDLLLPAEYVDRYYRRTFSAARLAVDPSALEELRRMAGQADRVYIDLDCDVFDPAYFPAVARPVPFGLAPAAVLGVIDAVWSERVRGLFVSEFDPGRDRDDRSLAAAVWLVEHALLRLYEPRPE
jgi:arginase family enzyme